MYRLQTTRCSRPQSLKNKTKRKSQMHEHGSDPRAARTKASFAPSKDNPVGDANRGPSQNRNSKERAEQRQCDSRTNHDRKQLSQLRLCAMFQQVLGAAATEIPILPEKRKRTRPWVICDVGTCAKIYLESCANLPEIKFGILIVRERLIISINGAERFYLHQGVMPMLHKSPGGGRTMG